MSCRLGIVNSPVSVTEIFEFENALHFRVLDVSGERGGGLIFLVGFLVEFGQTDDSLAFDVAHAMSVPVTLLCFLLNS